MGSSVCNYETGCHSISFTMKSFVSVWLLRQMKHGQVGETGTEADWWRHVGSRDRTSHPSSNEPISVTVSDSVAHRMTWLNMCLCVFMDVRKYSLLIYDLFFPVMTTYLQSLNVCGSPEKVVMGLKPTQSTDVFPHHAASTLVDAHETPWSLKYDTV